MKIKDSTHSDGGSSGSALLSAQQVHHRPTQDLSSSLGEEDLGISIDAVLDTSPLVSEISADTMFVREGQVHIRGFRTLPPHTQQHVQDMLERCDVQMAFLPSDPQELVVPAMMISKGRQSNLAEQLGKILRFQSPQLLRHKWRKPLHRHYPIPLDFPAIAARASAFAEMLEREFEESVAPILLGYETYEVAKDETARTLDLLRSLPENAAYFQREVGAVTSFLPRNQPLYAFACFAIVPSLMAREVHVRSPQAMQHFFFDLMDALRIREHFPNIHISKRSREEFLLERSAVNRNPENGAAEPVTDAVIFTGSMENADKMRHIFDSRVLFISNGAGHNPIVVSETAEVEEAVKSALRVQLYNQGQDCAAPNTILVHGECYESFVSSLREAVAQVKIGQFSDRQVTVGPLSERKELRKIQEIFVDNAAFLDPTTHGVIRTHTGLIEPTIILRPLRDGGNFTEHFAPIFFVQRYEKDDALASYFEDPRYPPHAMYVTLFGASPYVDGLVGKKVGGALLHDAGTIIHNTDLHAPGIERGTQPYGGYGRAASCISIFGKITAKPTLPQRDIFEQLVAPSLKEPPVFAKDGQSTQEPSRTRHVRREDSLSQRSDDSKTEMQQLHWAKEIAKNILEASLKREIFTCSTVAIPDHPLHAGDLRDLVTSYAVKRALKERDKHAPLVFTWQDALPLKRLTEGMDPSFSRFVGCPLAAIPDPLGQYPSIARRFEEEFERAVADLCISVTFRSQSELYQRGLFDSAIFDSLKRRSEIAHIMFAFLPDNHPIKEHGREEEFRETFFPLTVYSRFTGKNTTRILAVDSGMHLTYECLETHRTDTVNLATDRRAVLLPSVELAFLWSQQEIAFACGTGRGPVFEAAKDIAEALFEISTPISATCQTVSILGQEEASGTTKPSALSLAQILDVYESPVLLWKLLNCSPKHRLQLSVGEQLGAHYEEFDQALAQTNNDAVHELLAWCYPGGSIPDSASPPFSQAVTLGQLVEWDVTRFESVMSELGCPCESAAITSRLRKTKMFAAHCPAAERCMLCERINSLYASTLATDDRARIAGLRDILSKTNTLPLAELEKELYALAYDPSSPKETNQKSQRSFFTHLYRLLLGQDTGPRLSTILWAARREQVLKLLSA